MLTLADVDVFIQASHILRSVSLEVGAREVVCLVGRNGSGKTTTLRTIMGSLRPAAGRVEFRGKPIHGRRTHEIARLGLGWAPEDSGIFPDLTVAENIEIATWTRPGGRPAAERIELAYGVFPALRRYRSEEHTSELQSRLHLVCRLLLEKKKKTKEPNHTTTPAS